MSDTKKDRLFEIDEGYGFYNVRRNKDNEDVKLQISRESIENLRELFYVEDNNLMSQEDVNEELSQIFDFVIGEIANIIVEKKYKIEVIKNK